MAKLPRRPPERLPDLAPDDVVTLGPEALLARCYRRGGEHPVAWNTIRHYGPTEARFDHQRPPAREQERGIVYAAGDLPTAILEAFGETRVINRTRQRPWIAAFSPVRPIRLLDLGGAWPTRAGASQAINSSGAKLAARAWSTAVYEQYEDVEGLVYPSSMRGRPRGRRRLLGAPAANPAQAALAGLNVALYERAEDAFPAHPRLHLPLDHPGLQAALGVLAERFGYGLV